jgi:hypothetical protein
LHFPISLKGQAIMARQVRVRGFGPQGRCFTDAPRHASALKHGWRKRLLSVPAWLDKSLLKYRQAAGVAVAATASQKCDLVLTFSHLGLPALPGGQTSDLRIWRPTVTQHRPTI